jgi:hypothetical protein
VAKGTKAIGRIHFELRSKEAMFAACKALVVMVNFQTNGQSLQVSSRERNYLPN